MMISSRSVSKFFRVRHSFDSIVISKNLDFYLVRDGAFAVNRHRPFVVCVQQAYHFCVLMCACDESKPSEIAKNKWFDRAVCLQIKWSDQRMSMIRWKHRR